MTLYTFISTHRNPDHSASPIVADSISSVYPQIAKKSPAQSLASILCFSLFQMYTRHSVAFHTLAKRLIFLLCAGVPEDPMKQMVTAIDPIRFTTPTSNRELQCSPLRAVVATTLGFDRVCLRLLQLTTVYHSRITPTACRAPS